MFLWNDSYKVGVEEIDRQHEKLFSLLRDLHDAVTVGKGRTVVKQVLDGVVAYTKEHFATEERLMQKYDYADFAAHKHMHDSLVAQAHQLQEKTQHSALTLSMEVMKFLESWIAHHISEADRKLGHYLSSKGV
ncbi:MAG TPA: bacteriohemerythrin [Polyangiaceae bacterium]|nr:bacteriohemerythrin [Polyangiaceae bacterium]